MLPSRNLSSSFLTLSAAIFLSQLFSTVFASPFPRDDLHDLGYSFLMIRQCDHYCGVDNQFCCQAGEQCYTANNIASCGAGGGGGGAVYTTTWTQTNTYTSTYTQDAPAITNKPGTDCVPKNPGEAACGTICCADYQKCSKGQCVPRDGWAGGGGPVESTVTYVFTTDGHVTTQFSAAFRVTASSTITGGAGATGTFLPGADTGEEVGSGGLSGGAIAGIVIGVIAGLMLLSLLCFCCIVRGLWAAIFGRKKKDRRRSTDRIDVYEEYSRRGSRAPTSHSRRDNHTSWYGSAASEKKKSGGSKWLGIGAGAATLLALLNMNKKKKVPRKPRTATTESYYSYTDTSPSTYHSIFFRDFGFLSSQRHDKLTTS
jgi:hypothetical protein